MDIVSRISYEKISGIFDELSEKVISSGDIKQYPEMWKKFEEILLKHSWTFDEWENELNRRLNEKYHIFSEDRMEEDFFEGIIINKESIIHSYWDTENGGRKEKEISPDELIHCLWENIKLSDDVTLERIFDIVETNILLWEIVTGENIIPIIEESKKEFNGSGELINLEIYWDAEHDAEYKTLTLSPMFHAIGKPTEGDYLPEELKGYIYYGISFSSNNYLKILPIKLNRNFKIYSSDNCRDLKNFDNKEFKVLEMMKAIFYELNWFGTPEDRDRKKQEIMDDIKEIKNKETPTDI